MAKTNAAATQETDTYVEIMIPKDDIHDTERFFGDGERTMLIQKGKTVKVPRSIAEIFYLSQAQKQRAEDYILANARNGE